jgi:hypothetical protein
MNSQDLLLSLQQSFADLRQAVEDRRYDDVPVVLKHQQELFNALDFKDSESFDLLKQAQDLTNWAITLVRLQRAHTERAYAHAQCLKQMGEGYLSIYTPDSVDLTA